MEKKTDEPTCFGVQWEASAAECSGCFLVPRCQIITEQRKSGNVPAPAEEPKGKEKLSEAVEPEEPLEHLLKALEDRYDRTDEERDNATGIYFKDGGKIVVLVVVSKSTGRMKIQTSAKQKVLESLESIEDAEEVLADILG